LTAQKTFLELLKCSNEEAIMADPKYGLVRNLPDVTYDDAVTRVTEALKTEGFGILTEIDVKATMKKKLDVDFRPYTILGACNPPLAYKALSNEEHIGLLLPCNVVVMGNEGGGSTVSILNPSEIFGLVDNPGMASIATEVTEKLARALEHV
jgi:uncharacterized protein (DUF302 family)